MALEDMPTLVIYIALAAIFVGALLPVGLDHIYSMNLTLMHFAGESEDTATTSLVGLIPLGLVLAVFIAIVVVVLSYVKRK